MTSGAAFTAFTALTAFAVPPATTQIAPAAAALFGSTLGPVSLAAFSASTVTAGIAMTPAFTASAVASVILR